MLQGWFKVSPGSCCFVWPAAHWRAAHHTESSHACPPFTWSAVDQLPTAARCPQVRRWDVATGINVETYNGSKVVTSVASCSSSPDVVAFGGSDRCLRVWDSRTSRGEALAVQVRRQGPFSCWVPRPCWLLALAMTCAAGPQQRCGDKACLAAADCRPLRHESASQMMPLLLAPRRHLLLTATGSTAYAGAPPPHTMWQQPRMTTPSSCGTSAAPCRLLRCRRTRTRRCAWRGCRAPRRCWAAQRPWSAAAPTARCSCMHAPTTQLPRLRLSQKVVACCYQIV